MNFFLMVLIILLLGGGLGWLFLHDPGYVLVAWHQTSVEMSLTLALLLMLGAAVAGLVILELLLGVFGLRRVISHWSAQRRVQRAQQWMAEGAELLLQGHAVRAEKKWLQAVHLSPHPFTPAWLASEAARQRGEYQLAEDYLDMVSASAPHLPLELARLRLWMDGGQWEAVAARAKSLYAHFRKEPALAELLVKALTQLQAWQDLAEWLPKLSGMLGSEKAVALAVEAHRQVMLWMAHTGNRMDRVASLRRLKDYWAGLPAALREHPELVEACAESMVRQGFDDEAEPLVREMLARNWHNGLVALYGCIRSSHPEDSLRQAQAWQTRHPANPLLLLTLGRLNLQNRDWASARACLEQSLCLGKNSETYAEYVRLLQHLNDPEAMHYLVAGLQQLTTRPLPSLPMP